MVGKILAEHILIDWENAVTKGGKAASYDKNLAIQILNGKLVAPKGWISPETWETMREAQEGYQGDSCHTPKVPPETPEDAVKADPWAPEALGELR